MASPTPLRMMRATKGDMSESDYERAVLWVPDPTSPAGWIRRKVWAEEQPKRKKPPMGFGMPARHEMRDDQLDTAA
jgi:hypothetical protein